MSVCVLHRSRQACVCETGAWFSGCDFWRQVNRRIAASLTAKERGLTRHDLGRTAFMDEVWKWKEASGNRITTQHRLSGAPGVAKGLTTTCRDDAPTSHHPVGAPGALQPSISL